MKKEISVRYKSDDGPDLRFQPGEVIYRISENSVNHLKRYCVESAHPGEIYLVRRLDDHGLKTGDSIRLSRALSEHFKQDALVTKLLATNKDSLE